jgi:hypothetical protein
VADWAEWDLVVEETGVWLRGVANREMGSAVVQEQVQWAMEVGATPLELQQGWILLLVAQWVMPLIEMWGTSLERLEVSAAVEQEE